jgi:hypothetical protein
VHYGEYALPFLVSVFWRNLALEIDEGRLVQEFADVLLRAEQEWRLFLLGHGPLANFNHIHLIVTDFLPPESPQQNNVYLTRVADFSIAHTSSECALYLKFARFIAWAEITPVVNQGDWTNTLLRSDSGTLQAAKQNVVEDGFLGFIHDRTLMFKAMQERSRAEMTSRQRDKIMSYTLANLERIGKSELFEAIRRDARLPPLPGRALRPERYPKVGRNDPCPCGSGNKYKRCHGI